MIYRVKVKDSARDRTAHMIVEGANEEAVEEQARTKAVYLYGYVDPEVVRVEPV